MHLDIIFINTHIKFYKVNILSSILSTRKQASF